MLTLDLLTLSMETSCTEGSLHRGRASLATGELCCPVETFIWSETPLLGCGLAAQSIATSAVGILGATQREQEGHPRQCGTAGWVLSWAPSI